MLDRLSHLTMKLKIYPESDRIYMKMSQLKFFIVHSVSIGLELLRNIM